MKTMECKLWLSDLKQLRELLGIYETVAIGEELDQVVTLKTVMNKEIERLESLEAGTIVRID